MWMEILKDYDVTIYYHSGEANVVADSLIKKAESMGNFSCLHVPRHLLARELQSLANSLMRLEVSEKGKFLASAEARYKFTDQIKARQFEDVKLSKIRGKVLQGKTCGREREKKKIRARTTTTELRKSRGLSQRLS
ncbi:hypothetical protein MTR67_051794 [Solanum verrucosum]|uniref:Uncharacterized protein n=1 Tax=Solanum verrucosum TaxID=315347 RepID=A0AAF0V788_SOLVR|nr:hypothetical protein MTR67_051794 [Solanum verrucosum]